MFALTGSGTGDFQSAVVADADGDGTLEVYAVAATSQQNSSSTLYRLSTSLDLLGTVTVNGRGPVLLLEPSEFARKNLVLVTPLESGHPTVLLAVDPRSGKEVWRSPPLSTAAASTTGPWGT